MGRVKGAFVFGLRERKVEEYEGKEKVKIRKKRREKKTKERC